MEITFKPDTDATILNGALQAQVFGAWFQWPLGDESNICNKLIKGHCPVNANTEATYSMSIEIPFYAPSGTRLVELRITDQAQAVVACTRFLIQI